MYLLNRKHNIKYMLRSARCW